MDTDRDERLRALRRRALLAERLLVDLVSAADREMAAGLLVQALTAVGGSDRAELHAWQGDEDGSATSSADRPSVVLARSTAPDAIAPGDEADEDRPHRHRAIDPTHGLELVVDGTAIPPVAVDRALAAMGATIDRIATERALLREARTDALTGLMNRRAIDERIEGELARIERAGGSLSLLLIDLDGFKRVNDTFGHSAGDDLLRGVAEAMRRVARVADDVARIGGDEFVLLLPVTGRAGAHVVARRLRDELAELARGVSASVGIATVEDGPVPTVAELLSWADHAMYAAKGDDDVGIAHADGRR